MRQIDSQVLAQLPYVVMLTAKSVDVYETIMIADFKDSEALFHEPSGRFVGMELNGSMCLGKKPIVMQDGVWYMNIDDEMNEKYRGVPALNLVLRPIKLFGNFTNLCVI